MLNFIKNDRWSPFLVGLAIAVLSLFCFYFLHTMLGTSSTFVRIAAGVWYLVYPQHIVENSYYRQLLESKPLINWQFAEVIGIFFGSYFAGSFFSKSPVVHVPDIWRDRFGNSLLKRYVGAFIGGVIILFGARLAGGCTSGHGISGGMQLATTGWVFMVGLFAAGVPTVLLLYRGGK